MNTNILADSGIKINGRFVPANPDPADTERQIGRNLYRRGRPLAECVSDDMAAGWLAEEFAGYMAYSRHMEAEGVPCAKAFAFEGAL